MPIAVAHFDRRVHSTTYAVVVKPPFKISDAIANPLDPAQLSSFLTEYRQTYVGYVQEARELADRTDHHCSLLNASRLQWRGTEEG